MDKGFWMTKASGNLGDGDMPYSNSSQVESKRPHQWFMDGTEADFFPSKKQAVDVSNPSSFSQLLNSSVSTWGNPSSFQSVAGQFSERLFDSEPVRTLNFDARDVPAVGLGSMNMGGKVVEDPFAGNSSFGLSMSHSLDDPRSGLNYGGIRKVKVNQVKDSDTFMSAPMSHTYDREDANTMSTTQAYNKIDDNSSTMGLSFNIGVDNMIPMGDVLNRDNSNFMSMGQAYNKVDNIGISMSQMENSGTISLGQSLSKDDYNITTMGPTFKDDIGAISTDRMGQTYNEESGNTVSRAHPYSKVDNNTVSVGQNYAKVSNSSLSMSHSFSKGESNIISFGGLNDDDINPTGQLICRYDLLMGQSSSQRSEAINQKAIVESNADTLVGAAQIAALGELASKKKEEQKTAKKAPANNFPSNVRSLLSTGMLDGVPVKYTAWSREKELRGVIKGSGYLCGCQSCNFSKAINAYEFERHASCKTKHPNNHIYFENGKTVYGIVQELRNTPQNLLFEVIQTITGSPINQKSFRLWKESFLAATRELQRIYGKDEGKQFV